MSRAALTRAAELHAAGVAASNDMRPALGARRLRAALRVLDGADPTASSELRGRILVSLGYAVAEQGDTELGLRYLDDAQHLLPSELHGPLYGQRAVLLRRTGRDPEALAQYDLALATLREDREPRDLARVLLNRGVLHVRASHRAAARADLAGAAVIAQRHGFALIVAKARHNLAMLDFAAGDLPSALGAFAALSAEYARSAPGTMPLLLLDRARVLVAAGLYREADDDLASAYGQLRAQGMGQDEAEALLSRAEAALVAGQPADARRWARSARSRFARRGNERFAVLADLVAVRATYAARPSTPSLPKRALALADRLTGLGLAEDARVARLTAVRALTTAGRLDEAAAWVRACTRIVAGDRLDTRVLARLARAEHAYAAGRPALAHRALVAGLADLHRHRAQVGCLDLRSGAAAHGQDLAATALRHALRTGRVQSVFAWSERSRAQALLLPPVRPPRDPQTADALHRLRQLRQTQSEIERNGGTTRALRAECDALERLIRQRAWSLPGPRGGSRPVALPAVTAALGDRALAVYLRNGPRLLALVVTGRRSRIVAAGRADDAAELVTRLRASLDALAGRTLRAQLSDAIGASIRKDAAALAAAVLAPVLAVAGDRELVVVPTGGLLTAPWGLLPGCAGRPVTVAASASAWHAARDPAATPAARKVGLIAGPGTERAEPEVRQIAALYPDPSVLTGPDATVAASVATMDGADLVHVAAHGRHQGQNALFSAVELADGPLMGYDLQHLHRAPRVVVLSTCDLGLSQVRPGDETVGMSAALIAAGASVVVASVSRVADATAMAVATAFHRHMAAGAGPAAALAQATAAAAPTGFVCLGHG